MLDESQDEEDFRSLVFSYPGFLQFLTAQREVCYY